MTTQEFKNDYLTATMESLPNCTVRFVTEVKGSKAQDLRKKALKTISKEAKIPGFRPGKGPADLLEKKYGNLIDREFEQEASQLAVSDAVNLSKCFPLKREGGVQVDKFEKTDDGFKVIFHYETFPTVPDVDTDNLKITPPKKRVITDDEVEKTLKEIQLYHAKWNEVSERAAQEGDFVVIDIDVIDEPKFKAYENSRFHVVDGGMPKWARDLVIGLKPGESKEGVSEKDNDSEDEFVPRNCKITVNLIQTAELPELDDELAKKAGVDNVENLKKNIRLELEKSAELAYQDQIRMKMRDLLVEKHPFDLPGTDLKNLEKDSSEMTKRDIDPKKSPEEIEAYKKKLMDNGMGVVRFAYLIPHLASRIGIERPSKEAINQRMMQVLTQHYMKTMQQVPEEDYPMIFQKIERDLLTEAVLDKIIEKNL